MATACASTCCGPPARRRPRSSPSATTIEDGELTRDALQAVLEAFPQAAVMVSAFDRLHLIELDELDLAFAERELFESAVAMGRAALKANGIEQAEIDRVDREYRMRDCERLERQAETGDLKRRLGARLHCRARRCPTKSSKPRLAAAFAR